jgi:HPt (histidine-containing phosphotransfer) domain-containing protein
MMGGATLNLDKICDMLMLDEESVKNLLKKFAFMLPEMVNEIRVAADSKDVLLVTRLGHKLKGTAGNFRIEEMESISFEINKIKECDENTTLLIAKLQECADRLIVEINEL